MSDAVVFVTGSSRGIGLSVVNILLKAGHKVASFARSRTPELDALASKYGSSLLVIRGDVADPATATAAVQKAIATFGRLDGLILNAATVYPLKRLADVNLEEAVGAFQVNVFSIVPVLQTALPQLRQSKFPGGARVIAISSAASLSGSAGTFAYSASKAALNILVGALSQEEEKVTVIAFNPGIVETQMAKEVRDDGKSVMTEAFHGWMVSSHASGGNNHPDVPAKAIAALALRAPKELSGKYLDFDGPEAKSVLSE